jgi:hypothetical protein
MDGTEVPLGVSEGGGPCGVWREQEGKPTIAMEGRLEDGFLHE